MAVGSDEGPQKIVPAAQVGGLQVRLSTAEGVKC